MRHSLSDVDPLTEIATCSVCGPASRIRNRRPREHPVPSWRCLEAKRRTERVDPDNPKYPETPGQSRAYRRRVKDHCERCGFVPLVPMQLDVDHIDGNPRNHALDNLQTLCANCHRLKTYVQRFPQNAEALGISW